MPEQQEQWESDQRPSEIAEPSEETLEVIEGEKGILGRIQSALEDKPSPEEITKLKKAVERRAEITRETKGLPKLFETRYWTNNTIPDLDVPDPKKTPLKFCSFNIERGFKIEQIITWVKKLQSEGQFPDIFCTQEADWGCLRSGDKNIALELGKALGYKYIAFTTEWEEVDVDENSPNIDEGDRLMLKLAGRRGKKEIGKGGGISGQAILSRYPIDKITCIPLSRNWYDWEDFNNSQARNQPSLGTRTSQVATVKIGDQPIVIANTHLDIHGGEMGRLAQFDQVRKYLAKVDDPTIICGDLNTSNHGIAGLLPSNQGDLWTKLLRRRGETAAEMWHRTEFSGIGDEKQYVDPHDPKISTHSIERKGINLREGEQLDWILVEKGKFQIKNHSVGPYGLSDHLARLMEIQLN